MIAFAHKSKRLSAEVEKMARYGREWLPDDELLRDFWRAQLILFKLGNKILKAAGM